MSAIGAADVPQRQPAPRVSVVIPVYDEVDNVAPVHAAVHEALEAAPWGWELVVVDDGSSDGTGEALDRLAETDPRLRVVHLRRNFGQTAALQAGIDHAAGEVIVTMDGDGQNDPRDIPALVERIDQGSDVVSGWRAARRDRWLTRVLPSRIANRLVSLISGVRLHDYGCTLKAYRREVLSGVKLYGEMHRFIPIYATWQGARVAEVPVRHHPRRQGRSKYGLERTVKVLLDLMVVSFLERYLTKPIYVFGTFGLLALAAGFLAGCYALYLKLVAGVSFISTPLPLLVTLLGGIGVMSLLIGLLAEIVVRTYFEAQAKDVYLVRERVGFPE